MKQMNWEYLQPKFEYEEKFNDLAWPWAGHKYFAYDLVVNLKPKKIVELGTHYGTSLWSFSQAVKDNNLDTELNAVDTWEGEKHAGLYGEEVFETVNEIKNKYYSNLNLNLIRKEFSEAVNDFEDKSIDILHIDGLHTYEAVKYDFETWLSKVKDDGVVLFHDIIVTRDDFGVFKFWKELKEKYATFEFRHSYGLGVLCLDKNNSILNLKDDLELYYSYLLEDFENGKIAQNINALNNKNQEIKQKEQEVKQKEQEIQFIKSSKFWKIRNRYITYKSKLVFIVCFPRKFIKKYLIKNV